MRDTARPFLGHDALPRLLRRKPELKASSVLPLLVALAVGSAGAHAASTPAPAHPAQHHATGTHHATNTQAKTKTKAKAKAKSKTTRTAHAARTRHARAHHTRVAHASHATPASHSTRRPARPAAGHAADVAPTTKA